MPDDRSRQSVTEMQLDRLDRLLRSPAAPPSCMDLSELDGLLTGLAVGPQSIPSHEWLPVALGMSRPGVRTEQTLELIATIELRYATLVQLVRNNMESLQPVLWKGPNGTILASNWAEGFSEAVHLRRDAWNPLLQGEQSYRIMPILSLCRDDSGKTLARLDVDGDKGTIRQLAQMLPAAVEGIYDFWHGGSLDIGPLFPVSTAAVPGRNEPCSCGSGKKYKLCCEGRPAIADSDPALGAGLSLHRVGAAASEPPRFAIPAATPTATQATAPGPRWIGKGEAIEVQGVRISHGMFYLGSSQSTSASSLIHSLGVPGLTTASRMGEQPSAPHAIDPLLRVRFDANANPEQLPYEPTYRSLSPRQRGLYLRWLADGARARIEVTYVRLYMLGLERRLLLEAIDLPGESDELLAELDRLLSLFGTYNPYQLAPFARLREFMGARRWPSKIVPEEFDPALWDRENWPIELRYGLGVFARDRRPLPAAWALRMALNDFDVPKRTAPLRCPQVFARAFVEAYRELFGEGFLLNRNKARLTLEYHAVSPALRGERFRLQWDLPDLLAVAGPRKKLTAVVDLATTWIDPYSRLVSRHPEQAESLQALFLLPPTLWPPKMREHFTGIRETLPQAGEARPYGEWLARLLPVTAAPTPATDTPVPTSMTAGQTTGFVNALAALAIGFEPDILTAEKKPGPADRVVLFPLNSPQQPPRDAAPYRKAASEIALLSFVAGADGETSVAVEEYVHTKIRGWSTLHPDHRLRLLAHARLHLGQRMKPSALKARLAEFSPEERPELARSLALAANAGGTPSPARVRRLEDLYELLQLDVQMVYTHLHSAHETGRQGHAAVAAGPSGAVLDRARIAQVQRETAAVSVLLADVFTEDEIPAVAPPTPTPATVSSPLPGLDVAHAAFVTHLLERPTWTRAEVEALAAGLRLMVDGALERINEAALDLCGEMLVEGDDTLYVQRDVLEEVSG